MEPKNNYKVNARREYKVRRFMLLLLLITGSLLAVSVKQSVAGSTPVKAVRYYLRVSGCDDRGKAYLNNQLIVDVGFDEDSNWLDITEDVAQGRDKIKFEVVNMTVKTHVSSILAKLGVTDRTQAALYAARNGLLEAEPGS